MPKNLDALRAEVWRATADDQVAESPLLDRFLSLLGGRLKSERALFLTLGSDGLTCTREWRADPRLAVLTGQHVPQSCVGRLLSADGRLVSPAELPGLELGREALVGAFKVHGRIEAMIAFVRAADAEPWPQSCGPFLAETLEILEQAVARRRAEAAMRQSELRYKIVSELCGNFAFSMSIATDGTRSLEWHTGRNAADTGFTVDELAGGAWEKLLFPADLQRFNAAKQKCFRNERTSDDYKIATRAGEERWLQIDMQPVWDALAQRVVRIFGLVRDVTEQVLTDEALRKERDLVRAILEASPDGICVGSMDNKVVDCNGAAWRFAGFRSKEAMLGLPITALLGGIDRARAEEIHAEVRSGRPVRCVPLTGRGPDGREFPMEISIGLMRDASGRPAGMVGILKDIGPRVEREVIDRHAAKGREVTTVAAAVAHDFNNLLAAIMGNAGLALASLPAGSQQREQLRQVMTASEQAADLTRQLLAYSGTGHRVAERVDLSPFVSAMGHLFDEVSKGCTLRQELARSLPPIEADPHQLRQVIVNLVSNASEALGERGGIVALRTGARRCDRAYLAQAVLGKDLPEGEYVFVEVADDGCGMSEETLRRAFDPFFSTKEVGRGLGLPAAQGIMRAHRGALLVESESGRGTTVRVLFPAGPRVSEAMAPLPQVQPGGKVLVIDDVELVRVTARAVLENAGYAVDEAGDGAEGLQIAKRDALALRAVLLDMIMPGMGGAEVLGELRKLRADLPVLVASGTVASFVGKGDRLVAFIPKPYLPEQLVAALERLLALSVITG